MTIGENTAKTLKIHPDFVLRIQTTTFKSHEDFSLNLLQNKFLIELMIFFFTKISKCRMLDGISINPKSKLQI